MNTATPKERKWDKEELEPHQKQLNNEKSSFVGKTIFNGTGIIPNWQFTDPCNAKQLPPHKEHQSLN